MSDRLLRGTGVSAGVSWAPAFILRSDFPNIPDRGITADEIDGEVARLHAAATAVIAQLQELGERVLQRAGPEEARIFDAQIEMVRDPHFLLNVETIIRSSRLSAETAYEFKALEIRNLWSSTGNAHLRDRLADLHAIQLRMLHQLLGLPDDVWTVPSGEQVIVVARELSPGLTVQLDREHIAGLISEQGTKTSHAAILAHSLGIPAVMGVREAVQRIPDGALVLIDGTTGEVLVKPTRGELDDAKARLSRRHRLELQLESVLGQPAVTPDGHRVALYSNVDLPDEIEPALRMGAEGVGLLRTEFLLTGRASLPTEDEQAEYFKRVARAFAGRPVVIRSYDLGGDKFPAAFQAPPESNPFLGWRSIRVCLDQPEMFRAQLRAILRAAHGTDIRLMLPLVTTVAEVVESRALLAEEAAALAAAGIPAAASVPLGVMIETPAAVLIGDELAAVSDFFSVGTNDLTQYTLAVDRGNVRLAERFTSFHPAVVRQLQAIVASAHRGGLPAGVCGEFASDPIGAVLLLGMGYDVLSVAPPALPLAKWILRSIPMAAARAAAEEAAAAGTSEAVEAALRRAAGQYFDMKLLALGSSLPPLS